MGARKVKPRPTDEIAAPKCPPWNFADPKVIGAEAPPQRPERHVRPSIATLRRRLAVDLITCSRCPSYAARNTARSRRNL